MSEAKKFTAIYVESWMSGSHRHSVTRMLRIEKFEGETIADMLKREDIDESTVFLFFGHLTPLLLEIDGAKV
jgi:hypothetical protein